ncbi:MAG: glutamate--tRNA ligase [Ruminococcaceae bacterium]|nr:glutamate--tRNA ligase [Oscillospiraceae bacterium]
MDNNKLAQLLFPHINVEMEEYLEKIYPKRQLPEGAYVTRFAPSPTGFIHIGGLFTALVNERLAHQSGGKIFLRIEDTDKKREQEDGINEIITGLAAFGINFDEGKTLDGTEKGDYGPYVQSHRAEIYQSFCKALVKKGFAYPCFCTEEDLAEIRKVQEEKKVLPGYHTEYAKCRNLTYEEIEENIKAGKPYVVRLKSPGKIGGRVKYKDVVKGDIEMDENVADIVLLKTDGIPTYHFAHACDDTLMGTTHVVRSDEWVPSVNIHLQLFYVLGLKPPKYCHISPIMKEDNGGKRKLSKRKDPEAAVSYFTEEGYPKEAVLEYLLTLANSQYEDWRKQNKTADLHDYKFAMKNMSKSGALFDLVKLNNVSGEVISRFPAEKLYEYVLEWANEFDKEFAQKLIDNKEKAVTFFGVDRSGNKPRKDITQWKGVAKYMDYIFGGEFAYEAIDNIAHEDQKAVLNKYATVFDVNHTKDEWFGTMKSICEELGFSPDVKAYKADPSAFKGHVGDISTIVRVALTGRKNTPDLYSIMAILGTDEIKARINKYIETL